MSNRKINIVIRLQHWMDSVPGQTFLNYAYSWGAAIVILGTLFKLTHLPGANLMLFMGMGTEVVVFFLSAFDRPFDKGEQGKELPDDYETDEEIAAHLNLTDDDEDVDEAATTQSGVPVGDTIIIGGVGGVSTGGGQVAMSPSADLPQSGANMSVTNIDAATLSSVANAASGRILEQASSSVTPDMQEAAQAYVDKLKSLTETLAKVEEQSSRLTTDSEEMSNLNRTLTGINTVYELQLKNISMQVGTIDQINEQTRRMAKQIEELNGVYGRMIKALTVNMKNAAGDPNVE